VSPQKIFLNFFMKKLTLTFKQGVYVVC